MRDRFWELPLAELTREEWEALCDGCGKCCLHKLEDADTGEVEHTNVACKLLDCETARCSDYRNRKAFVPDCLRLTMKIIDDVPWLPSTCAYRLRAEGKPLREWHYLLSGSRETIKQAGVSVAGRVVSEIDAGPLEHHVVEWD
ncbi:YcgN family cysteine cluster protein [Erythrobacter sp. HKB08]|uniref:YcgN family cysteine cluster protein n=1 Tax=Erythrobacter sp. HKB08 TaxID=2502843 RepID=UPI00100934B7|nr:YcgN family cysteine cluster protein [Erythrobacter sp. HKB08]